VSEGVADGRGTPVVRSKERRYISIHVKTSGRLIRLSKADNQTDLNERQEFESRTMGCVSRLWAIPNSAE
jgi:hypothetical protein